MARTRTGIDILTEDPGALSGRRVGLLTNHTGTTATLDRNVDALLAAGVELVALFSPEHGLNGTAQAGASEPSSIDERTGLPVIDTYAVRDRVDGALAEHALDVLVYDMQDVGTRYWTYTWTMYDAMAGCARLGIAFMVVDRPNPLGGIAVEGPALDPRFGSFVGRSAIPLRHGLTSGELAILFNATDIPLKAGRPVELEVVELVGWTREMPWQQTGIPWVIPSPNLPTVESAFAFAATGLLEGTNVSEGRGTTRPFELFGAPYVDGRLVTHLRSLELPGVAFRETSFQPTFHKHAGVPVRGTQLHVIDTAAYRPVRTGLAVLQALAELYPDDFGILPPDPSADADHEGYALDRLWGSDVLRRGLTEGDDVSGLAGPVGDVGDYPAASLLYGRSA